MKPALERQSREFWGWFDEVSDELAANLENDEILAELDRRLGLLGEFSWEVGPGTRKENALVVSPNGSKPLLELTSKIVDLAPESRIWEFHHAKPPKQWELRFSVMGPDGSALEVDANEWEYAILRFPDGTFDIMLRAPSLDGLSEDAWHTAAGVAIEGAIGELHMIQYIGGIEAIAEDDETYAGKCTSMVHLYDHLNSLVSR